MNIDSMLFWCVRRRKAWRSFAGLHYLSILLSLSSPINGSCLALGLISHSLYTL